MSVRFIQALGALDTWLEKRLQSWKLRLNRLKDALRLDKPNWRILHCLNHRLTLDSCPRKPFSVNTSDRARRVMRIWWFQNVITTSYILRKCSFYSISELFWGSECRPWSAFFHYLDITLKWILLRDSSDDMFYFGDGDKTKAFHSQAPQQAARWCRLRRQQYAEPSFITESDRNWCHIDHCTRSARALSW